MKKALFLVVIALFITIAGKSQTKVEFDIAETLSYGELDISVVRGVYSVIADYFLENDYVLAANEYTFQRLLDIEWKNQNFSRILPSEHNPIQGGIYSLFYEITADGEYRFSLSHVNMSGDEDKRAASNSHLLNYLKTEDGQRLVAYEIITNYFGTTEKTREILDMLSKKEKDYLTKTNRNYTALSFLPPASQFQSHTPKGTGNGIAIVSGYAISIGGFIWSTASYNINKRRYDAVSVDLSEADKARAYYKGNMDMCRGGQIASAVLFAGTYIYGVVNALSNRSNYQGNRQIALAPIAYENGGGIALVYGF